MVYNIANGIPYSYTDKAIRSLIGGFGEGGGERPNEKTFSYSYIYGYIYMVYHIAIWYSI